MIILTDLLQPYLEDTESISNEDLGALIRYIKGYDSKPSKMVQVLALALKKDDEALVQRATERETVRKEKHRIANANWRKKLYGSRSHNSDIECDIGGNSDSIAECDYHGPSQTITDYHGLSRTIRDNNLNQDLNRPKPTQPKTSPYPQTTVGGSSRGRISGLSLKDRVDRTTYLAFASDFLKGEDCRERFQGWVEDFYDQSVSPIFSKWQNYVAKAIGTARLEGKFEPDDSPVDEE